jgi:hypothetical protein
MITTDSKQSEVLGRLPLLLVSLALFTATVLIAPPAQAADPGPGPTMIGVASWYDWREDLDYYDASVGSYPEIYETFWAIDNTDWAAGGPIDFISDVDARGIVPYAELTVNSLADLNSGRLDGDIAAMVAAVKTWLNADRGRRLLVGALPEANLIDFPWGGDPSGYKAGYNRIRTAFRNAGLGPDRVRFVFAMHGTSSAGLTMADFYPGDSVVDIVGFSIINRNDPWHDYDSAFQRFLDEIKGTISQSKPILITQTASVVEGMDRDGWLRDMFDGLKSDPQVIGLVYFNREKVEGGKYNDYRVLKTDWIDPVFRQGAVDWADPGQAEWIFDGRMDAWTAARHDLYDGLPYFKDAVTSPFAADIVWLASEGITTGCNPPTSDLFCPDDGVTRGQMAAFLVRALDLGVGGGDPFVDDDDSVFEFDIEALAAAGITAGCNPPANDRFCPDAGVTRGQMAAFLARALGS